MMLVELNQNSCNSSEVFKLVFNDGLCHLISNASLNSNSFQSSALSRAIELRL